LLICMSIERKSNPSQEINRYHCNEQNLPPTQSNLLLSRSASILCIRKQNYFLPSNASFVVIKMPPSLFKNPRFLIFSDTGGYPILPTPPAAFEAELLSSFECGTKGLFICVFKFAADRQSTSKTRYRNMKGTT